jgi:hypothetical protein
MELTEFRIAVAMGAYWKTVTNKQESIMQCQRNFNFTHRVYLQLIICNVKVTIFLQILKTGAITLRKF